MNGQTPMWMCVQFLRHTLAFCANLVLLSPPIFSPLASGFSCTFFSPPLWSQGPFPFFFLILYSPRVPHFAAQVLSPGSPGEPQSNLSLSAREGPSVLCLCVYGRTVYVPEGYPSACLMNHQWWWLGDIYEDWLCICCLLIEAEKGWREHQV